MDPLHTIDIELLTAQVIIWSVDFLNSRLFCKIKLAFLHLFRMSRNKKVVIPPKTQSGMLAMHAPNFSKQPNLRFSQWELWEQ